MVHLSFPLARAGFLRNSAAPDEADARRPLPILAAAAIGLVVALTAIGYLARERERALEDAGRELQNLAFVLAQWVESGFHSVEQLEIGIADWVRSEGIATPDEFRERLATQEAHELLRSRRAALPRVSRLFLVDILGSNPAHSTSFPPPAVNSVGRDYFDALRGDTADDTFLSAPSRNRVDGKWSIHLARRLRAPDGRFLGMAVAGSDLSFIEDFFAKLALGPDSPVALVRRDGLLLARHPHIDAMTGTSLAATETFTRVLANGNSGVIRGPSPIDGVGRIQAVQALPNYPLVVVTTRSIDTALASWHAQARRVGAAVLLLDALIVGAALLVERQIRVRAALHRLQAASAAAEMELALAREREVAVRAIAERDGALHAIFESGAAGVAELDAVTRRFTRVNARYCAMTGRSEAELLGGLGPADVVHPDDLATDLNRWARVEAEDGVREAEKRYLRPDGSTVWVRLSIGVSDRNADGRASRWVALVQDVTESRAATERLRASEGLLRLSMEVGRIGSFRQDATTGRVRYSPEALDIYGLPRDEPEVAREIWLARVHPEDRDRLLTRHREAAARGERDVAADFRIVRVSDGAVRYIDARTRHEYGSDGELVTTLGVLIDVTEQREAEALMRLSLEAGRIGSFRRDLVTGTLSLSPEARMLCGLPEGDAPISAEEWLSLIPPEDRAVLLATVEANIAARRPEGQADYRLRRPSDGTLRHFDGRVRYVYDAEGRPLAAVGVMIDVTERREAEARIVHLAHHDALTGLPNRVRFRERLDAALARARRGENFAVLCLDLDRFKEVNDTLGHPVGDTLLQAVTARLQVELRETDTLARLGGDEFAIIQSSVDQPRDATALARRMVETISAPFEVDGHQVVVGTSVGIAIAPSDGLNADGLLKGADMALYRAKAEGRGRWRFFEAEMDARMQLRRTLEMDLRRALALGEFELFYQPIVDVSSRRVSGLEALIRWHHPERGLMSPDAFVPLAEEIGLIVPIGEWVLARACADAVAWEGAPKVAINLSPVQFASRGLVDAVAAALAQSGLAPGRLELEITETTMLQDTDGTLATLHRLKALGVRIAMDDFGTGYSSLSYLQKFPFDKVKIDRCFTVGLEQSRQSNAIVRAVTDLCTGLEMTTTAEGVETDEQFQALVRKGCTEAQGYLFSRPQPVTEIPGLIARLGCVQDGEAALATAAE